MRFIFYGVLVLMFSQFDFLLNQYAKTEVDKFKTEIRYVNPRFFNDTFLFYEIREECYSLIEYGMKAETCLYARAVEWLDSLRLYPEIAEFVDIGTLLGNAKAKLWADDLETCKTAFLMRLHSSPLTRLPDLEKAAEEISTASEAKFSRYCHQN